jgi:hypothetical protein
MALACFFVLVGISRPPVVTFVTIRKYIQNQLHAPTHYHFRFVGRLHGDVLSMPTLAAINRNTQNVPRGVFRFLARLTLTRAGVLGAAGSVLGRLLQ